MKTINPEMSPTSRIRLLAGAFFLATLLVACGPTDNPASNGNPDTGETDTGGNNGGGNTGGENNGGENNGGENNGGDSGSGDTGGGDPVSLDSPVDFTVKSGGIKTFEFTWTDSANATFYKLLENIDGQSGFSVIRDNIPQGEEIIQVETSLHRAMFAQYMLQACNAESCSGFSDIAFVQDNADELVKTVGFIKASNAQTNDRFGGLLKDEHSSSAGMSLSADGQTLVVGAPGEDSQSITVGGVEDNNSRNASGAVYVYSKSESGWVQQAYIKARNADANDHFGNAVSVSADGNILVVGAIDEDSNGQGVDPSDIAEQNNSAGNSGAVYVFTRDVGQWSQQSYIKSSNSGGSDQFGQAVSISADGLRMVVGAFGEDSNTTGVSTVSATDNAASNAGAVYVFDFVDGSWVEKAYIKASNTQGDDLFGANVRISADGNTIAVGTQFEDSNSTVINGDGTNNGQGKSGAVYVFAIDGEQWSEQAYIKASNSQSNDLFGDAIDLSGDGNTLVVGARGEDSGNLNESDNSRGNAGAAYVYVRNGVTWNKQAYVKANTIGGNDLFGRAVSISDDGTMIAVSANGEDSSSPFLKEVEDNNGLENSGAVYVFDRIDDTWVQRAFVKASNPGRSDQFGRALDLNQDGSTLAVGTDFDDNGAVGINGDQTIKGANESGVVYLY
ncbi:hypothetical protein [Reinekea blandensis]|uniref:Integrin alpha beta-propellor repeat protein n=1 Tax=Reinekea blandensis MED297 TaxID=314283 RepID=A4BAT4_9GAMM|nr:hypothetical protein [Reinekea blandensis]EAR10547.1 hypothetical protein MED297_11045 [Reinekea sp. MED297] [Reinekea blandensis MED297]